jgi:hypothetical protein|tara:strand:+ start:254 stop:400 length:147 start_codon:yes stop_codon:yes gene_type:complete
MEIMIKSFLSFEWIDIFLMDLFIASIGITILFGFIWIVGKIEEYSEKK